MRIVINVFHSMTFLRKTSLVKFCDGRSMTILVTQRKCHHCNSVTKNHVFSDDNRSSWIVKSLCSEREKVIGTGWKDQPIPMGA